MKTGIVKENKDKQTLKNYFRKVHFKHSPSINSGSNLRASDGAVPDSNGRAGFKECQHSGQAHVANSNECDARLGRHFEEDEELPDGKELKGLE